MLKKLKSLIILMSGMLCASSQSEQAKLGAKSLASVISVLNGEIKQSVKESIKSCRLLDIVTAVKPVQDIILGYLNKWESSSISIAADADIHHIQYAPHHELLVCRTPVIKQSKVQNSATCYSPDGKYLAVAQNNGSVSIWDRRNYRCVKLLEVKKNRKTLRNSSRSSPQLAFSPDGTRLVCLFNADVAKLWDIDSEKSEDLQLPVTFTEKETSMDDDLFIGKTMLFSPDGRYIAAILQNFAIFDPILGNPIVIWRTADLQHVKTINGFHDRITFSHDSKWLASADGRGPALLKIFDTRNFECVAEDHWLYADALAYLPGSNYLVLARMHNSIQFAYLAPAQVGGYCIETGELFASGDRAKDIVVSPDGSHIVALMQGGKLFSLKNQALELAAIDSKGKTQVINKFDLSAQRKDKSNKSSCIIA